MFGTANFNSIALDKKDKMIIFGTKGKIELSIHGNDPVIIQTQKNEEILEFNNPKIIQENMVADVVSSLLTGKHLNSCSGEEALETYRIMDVVLEKYYNGREDEFWNRKNSWNKQ